MFKKIETGLIESGKSQRVFLIPFARECKVYANYEEIAPELRETPIPLVLMQLRWDGKNGFAGGIVEKGEDLKVALKREAEEEFNLILDDEMFDKVKPLATYANSKNNIHSFIIEVDYETIKQIQENASKSKHFLAEVQGCYLPQLAHYKNGKGIKELLKNNFSGTAKQELIELLKMLDLVSEGLLQEVAVYNLEAKLDDGTYKGKTGELITLKQFLDNIEKSELLKEEKGIDIVYDKTLPTNIIGIKVDDTDCPHGELVGQIRFLPYKLHNCFLYEED